MKEFKGTTTQWQCDGRTLYSLQDSDRPNLNKENRFSSGFYAHKGCSEQELNANIRLCVAAPKLLEALRQLRDYVEDVCCVSSEDCDNEHPLMLASSAIAKALGETR